MGKIDHAKLDRMLKAGKTVAQCSRYFKCSSSAVSQAKLRLKEGIVARTVEQSVPEVHRKSLNTVDQLMKINRKANALLESVKKQPDLQVRIMAEIRAQLKLQLDIFQTLYDVQAAKEFQEEVIAAIGEVEPDVRERIIQRLQERRAVHAVLQHNFQ